MPRLHLYSPILALGLSLGAFPAPARAQSDHLSDASAASLEASVEVPIALYDALKAGAHFTVTGVQASARGTLVTISVAPAFGSILLAGLVEPDYSLLSGSPKTSVGTALVVSGGLLLMVGSAAIAFIPDPSARPHIHSRRIHP
ncbi:hypothetical protein [Pseudoxanthomonas sacheonensis]|uniref:hypothetical protein n=1 Tax=Pseudoxanthomonas sacheonensis TaxID=443615 RepID=UPI0013D5501A|nr:hypothetical protein [Pseudoxanthomonas sacheonensis]KAF1712899.1 hypothetical protein CSC73_01040 [Pseudoxanthomonas sacheonensis]